MFTAACHLLLYWARQIHSMPSHPFFSKIWCNIILPYMPRCSKWSLSFILPHQNSICTSPPVSATCPVYLILLDLTTWIILGEECRSQTSSLCSLSSLLWHYPSKAQISSSLSHSLTSSAFVFLWMQETKRQMQITWLKLVISTAVCCQ